MFQEIFIQAFVYLAAAVLAVPVARRFGLGSALGYLLAGVLIGPFVLGLVGEKGQDVMHFAEFGVVMMLFLIGLELEPRALWDMRDRLIGHVGTASDLDLYAGHAVVDPDACTACGVCAQIGHCSAIEGGTDTPARVHVDRCQACGSNCCCKAVSHMAANPAAT